ncbi:MAG: hypothetical protein Q9196_000249 [Gyalolechia fulgens]
MPGSIQPASAPTLPNRLLYCLDQEDVDEIQPAYVVISEIVDEALVRQDKYLLDTISLEIYYEVLSERHMLTDRIRESLWVWTPFSEKWSMVGDSQGNFLAVVKAILSSDCAMVKFEVRREGGLLNPVQAPTAAAPLQALPLPPPTLLFGPLECRPAITQSESGLILPTLPSLLKRKGTDGLTSEADHLSIADSKRLKGPQPKVILLEDSSQDEDRNEGKLPSPAKLDLTDDDEDESEVASSSSEHIDEEDDAFNEGKGRTDRHLAANKQEEDAQCPSQAEWPILCACVESGPTSQFGPQQGLNLIIVPAKLISNWRNEYEGIYDRKSHEFLDLRFFVCHGDSSYSSDHPSPQDLAPFRVKEGTTAPWEHQRCILITTPGTFHGHVLSVINTVKHEWRVPQNRKKEQKYTITEENLTAGYVVADEYHESKGSTTQLFTIIKQIKMRNPAATITGVSGTPWSRSPKDLVGIFQVMSTDREDVWAQDPVLRHAIGPNINEIVRAFENSTKAVGDLVIWDKLRKHVNHLTEILEACVYLENVYKGQPRRRFRFVSSSMVASDRQDVVDAFQEKSGSDPNLDCDILTGTLTMLGTGINLTRARKLIIMDLDYLEASIVQALMRTHRVGQLNSTESWVLRCSVVEADHRMYQNQKRRGELMKAAQRTEKAKRAAAAALALKQQDLEMQ